MKFAKRYIEDIKFAGWRDKYFLSYKELKKLVRLIGDDGNAEAEFMCLLNNEIDKFNEFSIEKQEEFIIRIKELVQNMKTEINLWRTNGRNPYDFMEMKNKLINDSIDLHGEMVLLINYCNINYIGLAKIMKKYDRKTDEHPLLPYLQKMYKSFLSTNLNLITTHLKEYENMIDEISQDGEEDERSNEEVVLDIKRLFKSTVDILFTAHENVMPFEESNAAETNECSNIKHTRWHHEVQFGIKALHLVWDMISFMKLLMCRVWLRSPIFIRKSRS